MFLGGEERLVVGTAIGAGVELGEAAIDQHLREVGTVHEQPPDEVAALVDRVNVNCDLPKTNMPIR